MSILIYLLFFEWVFHQNLDEFEEEYDIAKSIENIDKYFKENNDDEWLEP